jgi:predicted phosphodiesterase
MPHNKDNVLVIGDTHAPFCKKGYLQFCIDTARRFRCGTVVHIGDEVDNHAISFHESDPAGMSPGDEMRAATAQLKQWFEAFPRVKVCIGNHTALPFRRLFSCGLPAHWLRSYQEIIGAPKGWEWDFDHTIHGVRYTHGTGSSGKNAAIKLAMQGRVSTVIGHIHAYSGVHFHASPKDILFGMQVGCGIDRNTYAFAYGRDFIDKPLLSCGVVLDKGRLPLVIPMPLQNK